MQIQAGRAVIDQDRTRAFDALDKAQTLAKEGLADIRRSIASLRATPLDNRSLFDAIGAQVDECRAAGVATELTVRGQACRLSPQIELALYRAAQEGLTNVQKHAQASHVALSVQLGEYEARLVLRDDGQGFDTRVLNGSISPQEQGFGLRGIRERLEMVRGQLALRSSPQRGTELAITIPRLTSLHTRT